MLGNTSNPQQNGTLLQKLIVRIILIHLVFGGVGLVALSFGVWMSHPTGCVFDLSSVTSAIFKSEKGGAVIVAISFQVFFENPTKSTVQVGEVRFELICYHAKLASIKADGLFLVPAIDKKILVPRTLREENVSFLGKDSKKLDAEVHRKYVYGGHVAAYMKTLMEYEPEKYQSHIFLYIKKGIKPDGVEAMYKKVHAAIRANPSAKTFEKRPPTYNLKKLTYEERKAKLIERLNALNAAGRTDDDDNDEDDD
ncbi:hypothetical protein LguiA_029241 [Lonicera macranthoides]